MFEHAEELRNRLRNTGEKQLIELAELLEMQEALDMAILKEHGINEYPTENIKLALCVELGEMLNELPTIFKHWKKTAKDNREKALVEYVDALHFALSLTNDEPQVYFRNESVNYDCLYCDGTPQVIDAAGWMMASLSYITSPYTHNKLMHVFVIGSILGFKWNEIYKAYKDKNEVNYQRLKEGY